MNTKTTEPGFFGTESVGKILWRIAPPVMLSQPIQALYNIVDGFCGTVFHRRLNGGDGDLSAAAGHRCHGCGDRCRREHLHGPEIRPERTQKADGAAGTDMVLALLTRRIFALISLLIEDLGCCIKNRSCESADCFARAVF